MIIIPQLFFSWRVKKVITHWRSFPQRFNLIKTHTHTHDRLLPSDIHKFYKLYVSCLIRIFDRNTSILLKNVHDQVPVFDQILMNTLTNYVPNIYMTFDNGGYFLDEFLYEKLNLANEFLFWKYLLKMSKLIKITKTSKKQ